MSVLENLTRCALLHRGGEAQIYKVCAGSKDYCLKWYADGCRFDETTVDTLSRSRHPGVYRILESGERGGRPYLVYDFIDGVASGEMGAMPLAVALGLMRQVVAALCFLRERGISHGDLNPANVVLDLTGKAVLIDCGIVGPGALAFAAPERFQGKPACEKSDLFSLGLLLYRWIAGENLVVAKNYEEFAQKMAQIDQVDVTSLLFAKLAEGDGRANVACGFSAEGLSVLEPLWKGLCRANPEDRVEDLDELDELLEIALDRVSGGDVALAVAQRNFVESLKEKNGAKIPESAENCGLPKEFANNSRSKWNFSFLLVVILGIVILVAALVVAFVPGKSGIDETGMQMLQKTRSMESELPLGDARDSVDESGDSVPVHVLDSLPMPVDSAEGGADGLY